MPPTTKENFHTLVNLVPAFGATFSTIQAAAQAARVQAAFSLNGVGYFSDEAVELIREALNQSKRKAKA